ncbi:MAG: response regulator [Oscillospiraceae bacterium]
MIRAVVCDDEPITFSIIQKFLKIKGFPIEIIGTAENGRDAVELIQHMKPDLAFVDIQMPYMNGFEVIRQIHNTNVIVITAFDTFEYAQNALRLGARDILLKPIDFDQLTESISRAVGWQFTKSDSVNSVLYYIHSHFREKIELQALSQIAYCSESYLARQFKKHVGTTIIFYVHKLRIQYAIQLFRDPHNSVQWVSEQVGYQNLNNFYKYFKLYTGNTPANFLQKTTDVYSVLSS